MGGHSGSPPASQRLHHMPASAHLPLSKGKQVLQSTQMSRWLGQHSKESMEQRLRHFGAAVMVMQQPSAATALHKTARQTPVPPLLHRPQARLGA